MKFKNFKDICEGFYQGSLPLPTPPLSGASRLMNFETEKVYWSKTGYLKRTNSRGIYFGGETHVIEKYLAKSFETKDRYYMFQHRFGCNNLLNLRGNKVTQFKAFWKMLGIDCDLDEGDLVEVEVGLSGVSVAAVLQLVGHMSELLDMT